MKLIDQITIPPSGLPSMPDQEYTASTWEGRTAEYVDCARKELQPVLTVMTAVGLDGTIAGIAPQWAVRGHSLNGEGFWLGGRAQASEDADKVAHARDLIRREAGKSATLVTLPNALIIHRTAAAWLFGDTDIYDL